MKRFLFIFGMLILGIMATYAQDKSSDESYNREATEAFLNQVIRDELHDYVKQPVSKFYKRIKKSPYKIKHMSTIAGGAWVVPDGIERMTGVILYNRTLQELNQNQKVYIIYIHLDTWLDDHLFWKSLPKKNWMEAILERTKDMRVTGIKFDETTIFSNPKDE